MTPEDFEKTIRSFVYRQPFLPFVVEQVEGPPILIDKPDLLAFNGGGAGYLSEEIHLINCENVREIHLAMQTV